MTTPVAAAASVPFSSTSMTALWTTFEIERSRSPSIPEKSALSPKARGIPICESVSSSENSAAVLKRGSVDHRGLERSRPRVEAVGDDRLLDPTESVLVLRQDDEHRGSPVVGQREHLGVARFRVR